MPGPQTLDEESLHRVGEDHTWLLVEDPLFHLRLVMEAHTTGFRLISLAEFEKDNKVVALVAPSHSLKTGQPAPRRARALRHLQVAKWFKKRVENPWTSPRALFCSEAVVRVMKSAHYPGGELFDD